MAGADEEARALRWSLAGSVVVAALGVTWGVVSGSRVVLLDGVFVLVGIVLTSVSILSARLAGRAPDARYPFGRQSLTPLAIVVQGLALLGTLVYAAADAVVLLRAGGSDATPSAVLVYGLATLTLGFAVAWWLPRQAPRSELVAVEAVQWRAGSVLSLVMAVGALVATMVERFTTLAWQQYVDPVLVLVAVAVLTPTPIRMLRDSVGELGEAGPGAELDARLRAAIAQVTAAHGLDDPLVRASKLGNRLYLEVDYLVAPGRWYVEDEDRVRRAVIDAVTPLGYDLWANVELTTDRSLVE